MGISLGESRERQVAKTNGRRAQNADLNDCEGSDGLRELDHLAADLPAELSCHTADNQVNRVSP